MMICALRGTPFLYYGQELGLPDAEIPPERVVDVDGRDPERAPMPWRPPSRAGPGAGFTTGEPWLPVVADAECLCVEPHQKDLASTLAFVRSLLRPRAREPALQSGTQFPVSAGPDMFCFERRGDQRFLVNLVLGPDEGIILRLGLSIPQKGPRTVGADGTSRGLAIRAPVTKWFRLDGLTRSRLVGRTRAERRTPPGHPTRAARGPVGVTDTTTMPDQPAGSRARTW